MWSIPKKTSGLLALLALLSCGGSLEPRRTSEDDPQREPDQTEPDRRRTSTEDVVIYRCGEYLDVENGHKEGTLVLELRGPAALDDCLAGAGTSEVDSVRLTLDPVYTREGSLEIDTAFDYFYGLATVEKSGPMDCADGAVHVWWQLTKERDTYSLLLTMERDESSATYMYDGVEEEIRLAHLVGESETCPPASYDRAD